MAGYGRKSKSGGFTGNLAKMGGRSKKFRLKTDMKGEHMHPSLKKASKQAHKKV